VGGENVVTEKKKRLRQVRSPEKKKREIRVSEAKGKGPQVRKRPEGGEKQDLRARGVNGPAKESTCTMGVDTRHVGKETRKVGLKSRNPKGLRRKARRRQRITHRNAISQEKKRTGNKDLREVVPRS